MLIIWHLPLINFYISIVLIPTEIKSLQVTGQGSISIKGKQPRPVIYSILLQRR